MPHEDPMQHFQNQLLAEQLKTHPIKPLSENPFTEIKPLTTKTQTRNVEETLRQIQALDL